MEIKNEKVIGLVLIVILFVAMAVAIAVILVNNPAPEKNSSTNENNQYRNYSPPPVQEKRTVPQSKTEEKSAPAEITKEESQLEDSGVSELSQMKISNPEGGSLLKAEYVDCGKGKFF